MLSAWICEQTVLSLYVEGPTECFHSEFEYKDTKVCKGKKGKCTCHVN